jgi:Kef-type K+ transport system membrane component KefB
MMSRGEIGLIVASVGVVEGLITQSAFSAIVGVVIITTLLTPPLLRASFQSSHKKKNTSEQNSPIKTITPDIDPEGDT